MARSKKIIGIPHLAKAPIESEIKDLEPMKNWYKAHICLMGDAAHAATPNMGQGACQAIEDAYVISSCLEKNPHHDAFLVFQQIRHPKANKVVKMSWTMGKMAHLANPVLRFSRNLFMRFTPAFMARKQYESIFHIPNI